MAKKCKMLVLVTAEEIERYKRENSMPCFEHKTCDTCKFYREEGQQEEEIVINKQNDYEIYNLSLIYLDGRKSQCRRCN